MAPSLAVRKRSATTYFRRQACSDGVQECRWRDPGNGALAEALGDDRRVTGSRRTSETEIRYIDFDGHGLAYRVSGRGPALVLPYLYKLRADMIQARVLSDRWRVFQISPIGHGYSDRVPGYSGEALTDQITAVLDRHDVDRFVVWGYSSAGAMACCIAQESERAAGLICGGLHLGPGFLRPALIRQLDRRLRPDHPNRSLWWWMKRFDWHKELATMSCARLLYWGSEDARMAPGLTRAREDPSLQEVGFLEFPGLDHGGCSELPGIERQVVPAVAEWISARLGPSW